MEQWIIGLIEKITLTSALGLGCWYFMNENKQSRKDYLQAHTNLLDMSKSMINDAKLQLEKCEANSEGLKKRIEKLEDHMFFRSKDSDS